MRRNNIGNIEELLESETWYSLSDDEKIKLYFQFEKKDSHVDGPIKILEYKDQLFSDLNRLRNNMSSLVIDPNSVFYGLPENSSCLMASEDKNFVGYILFEDEIGFRQVKEIFVEPSHRKKGIMNRLFSSIESTDHNLCLLVRKDNFIAQTAFTKYGFINEGSHNPGYYLMTKSFGF